ncbi:MAG: NTP transferase domain-containing protein, partial [Firmicutes bacterium]|nr:NTP transferase domain-containing protein [Bacillota bacterium]
MPDVKAVLLAGGRGERLWPLSTPELPKAFLSLTGPDSLLRQAFQRIVPWLPADAVYVVAAREHGDLVRQHLPELPPANLIPEPAARNTGPALGLASLWLEALYPATPLVVLPVDHWIGGERRFRAALEAAVAGARQGWVVTLGLRPTRPETGYGYIEVGEPIPPGTGPDGPPGRGPDDPP